MLRTGTQANAPTAHGDRSRHTPARSRPTAHGTAAVLATKDKTGIGKVWDYRDALGLAEQGRRIVGRRHILQYLCRGSIPSRRSPSRPAE